MGYYEQFWGKEAWDFCSFPIGTTVYCNFIKTGICYDYPESPLENGHCLFTVGPAPGVVYCEDADDCLIYLQETEDCWCSNCAGGPLFQCCNEPGALPQEETLWFRRTGPISGLPTPFESVLTCHNPGSYENSYCSNNPNTTSYIFEYMYCDPMVICWSAIYFQENGERTIVRNPGRLPKIINLPQANLNKPIQLIEDGIEMPSENYLFKGI